MVAATGQVGMTLGLSLASDVEESRVLQGEHEGQTHSSGEGNSHRVLVGQLGVVEVAARS